MKKIRIRAWVKFPTPRPPPPTNHERVPPGFQSGSRRPERRGEEKRERAAWPRAGKAAGDPQEGAGKGCCCSALLGGRHVRLTSVRLPERAGLNTSSQSSSQKRRFCQFFQRSNKGAWRIRRAECMGWTGAFVGERERQDTHANAACAIRRACCLLSERPTSTAMCSYFVVVSLLSHFFPHEWRCA